MVKKHPRRGIALVAAGVAAALALAGCAGVGSSTETGDYSKLVIAQSADTTTLDPGAVPSINGERIDRNIYSRLVTLDPETLDPVGDLATDWEQVDDLTWDFTLRDDVKFSDGSALTGDDVVYSLMRVATDQTLTQYSFFSGIESVTADGDTIEIKTKAAMPTMLRVLASVGGSILPQQLIADEGMDAYLQSPVGSGPYKIDEWVRDDHITLSPSSNYFGDTPKWAQVVVRTIPEASTRVSELLTGGADIVTDVDPTDWDRLDDDGTAQTVLGPSTRVMLLALRTNDPWVTADSRVREAIDLAIDKDLITSTLFKGEATTLRERAVEGVFGANPDLLNTSVYDQDRAKELVQEVGGGQPITIHITAPSDRYLLDTQVAQLIVSELDAVGFDVQLDTLSGTAYLDAFSNKTNQEGLLIALGDPILDSSSDVPWFQGGNSANVGRLDYENPEVDALITAAASEMDDTQRQADYEQIWSIISEDRPAVFLYQQPDAYGVSDRVNFTPVLDERIYFDDITVN
ncbi:MAG: ABC transporter substrate-binding protein [Microbacterium sp.]|uniref:ABC transporter substrate-binding protein n=1 Tax=Microbacterium sp. TaxID=51671 RepID=UPI0039E3D49B